MKICTEEELDSYWEIYIRNDEASEMTFKEYMESIGWINYNFQWVKKV